MQPVSLPQKPLYSVALHRFTDSFAGDDRILAQDPLRFNSPIRYEVTRNKTLSVLLNILEIPLDFQDTLARQSKAKPL